MNRFRDDTPLPAFGSANDAEEDLVAEQGASMLLGMAREPGACGRGCASQRAFSAGMTPQVANAAACIAGRLRALASDRGMVVVGAARAERAVGWITGAGERRDG